jgi:hypothetical protein
MVTSTGVHIVKPLRRASGVRWLDGESRIDTAGAATARSACDEPIEGVPSSTPVASARGIVKPCGSAGHASSDWTYGGEGSMRDETMMSKSVLYMSMSLDGFVTGPSDDTEHGLGVGGERVGLLTA